MRRGVPHPTADGIGDCGIGGVLDRDDPTVPWEAMGHQLESSLVPTKTHIHMTDPGPSQE
jgi:hypothetical protein